MKIVYQGIEDAGEHDSKKVFFQTLFDKMHLELNSIKYDKLAQAETNLNLLINLLNEPGAGEQFVESKDFYTSGMTGLHVQR